MKTFLSICFVIIVIVGGSNAFDSNKTVEGYRAGFLMECPGSMNPVVISEKMRGNLEIYTSGADLPFWKRKKYTYYTMGEMAKDPDMNWSKNTIFYIPGWLDNIRLATGNVLTQYYKKLGYNIMILNCVTFQLAEYPVAVRIIPTIGKHVGEMLAKLTAMQPKFSPKRLQLIGLSIGGQTQSFIAKEYYKLTGVKIGRITGLDPSGPCFRNRGPEGRIDSSDADFVDLVMTNIDSLGMAAPAGHVNFYVNGGETQPGDLYWMYCGSFCSHARSFTLWQAALDHPNDFIAIKCDSVQDARNRNCYDRKPRETNILGLNVHKNRTGIFYLSTSGYFPFAMGKKGLKKENDYIMSQLTAMNAAAEFVY